jgi:hypothetical protein
MSMIALMRKCGVEIEGDTAFRVLHCNLQTPVTGAGDLATEMKVPGTFMMQKPQTINCNGVNP